MNTGKVSQVIGAVVDLEFEGKMPPGTSGSLVIRIPVRQPEAAAEVNRLQDLDFDEEYQRVKTSWLARSRSGGVQEMPLQFRCDVRRRLPLHPSEPPRFHLSTEAIASTTSARRTAIR